MTFLRFFRSKFHPKNMILISAWNNTNLPFQLQTWIIIGKKLNNNSFPTPTRDAIRESVILFASAKTWENKLQITYWPVWIHIFARNSDVTELLKRLSSKIKTSASLRSWCFVWESTIDSARFRSTSCETL